MISFETSENNEKRVLTYNLINSNFIEKNSSNKEINLLEDILKNSTASILFEFYSKNKNSKYPEINNLKSLTKNEQGILDIEKLAKVLKENKSSFSKYLDE